MKLFRLIRKEIALLYHNNRVAFFIFLLVQVTVSIGFLFFFTTTYTAQQNYVRQYNSMRTIAAKLPLSMQVQEPERLPEKLMENSILTPTNLTFSFILPSEKGSDAPRNFTAYWNPEEFAYQVMGKKITKQHIQSAARVLISGNEDLSQNGKQTRYATGSTVQLDGMKFQVIGTNPLSYQMCGEIPYTVGLQSFVLTQINVTVPAGAADNEKQLLSDYVRSLLPGAELTVPQPLTQRTFASLLFPFLAALLIGISALVNLLFIFKYMLENNKKSYFVLQVCGCSRSRMLEILFGELLSLFTGCYLLGVGLFAGLRYAFRTNSIFADSAFLPSHILIIYLITLCLIILLILPYLRHYGKQIVNSGGEL